MRKSFVYAAGLMCLALSITDCQKELVEQTTPASEPNFELFAQPVTTKTANVGLDTRWVAKDAINVFHAEAGSTTYVIDNQFTVKDIETGRFDGTVSKSLSADKSYDWYAFYPYSSYNKTPAGISKDTFGYTTIGGTSQTQTGNGSRAHLAGESCPLYGIASNVASDKVPSISMNHLTSVIKVSVTNNSGEDLTVSSVSFTGTEDIVGTYFINFAASPVAYKSSGNAYVSSTASLTVSNGEALANGSSADFYIALKPFTAKTGTTLKLAVNGYEKTLKLKNDVTFTAGHIKTLGFNVDKKIPKKVWTIVTDASTLAAGDKIVIVSNSKKKVAAGIESDYLKETSAQFSSDLSTIESMFADASVFTLGGSANSWTLSNSDGALLGATAAKKLAFNKGTTSWKITISESDDATIQNGNNSYGKILHNVNNTRFSTYTSATNVSMLLPQIYRLESALPALATPTVDFEIQNLNSIFVMWSQVEGAKDYTVTCGDKTVKVTGDKYTFEGLAYSTEYTISVVANPADASVNAPSAAGTATATTGANPAGTTVTTYQHIFVSKPSIGSVSLSGVTWTLAASNLGNYNSTNYAGVQFGTKNSSGSITLTSSAWSYKEKTKITGVRIWLNAGSGVPTATVSIGGKDAKSDGKVVQKNTKAKSYKDATMLTFTPVDGGDSGIVVIKASTSSKAAYICAMEIDCL